jgi:hypothetical protein
MDRAGRLASLVLALATTAAPAATADGAGSSDPPLRVRVTAPTIVAGRIDGRIVAVDDANLTLLSGGETRVVPAEAVTRVEVRRKTHRKGRGVRIGALAGLAVGVAVGFAAGDDCGAADAPTIVCVSREASAAGVGLAGALLGAGVGALAVPGERWELVDYKHLTAGFVRPSARRPTTGVYVCARF